MDFPRLGARPVFGVLRAAQHEPPLAPLRCDTLSSVYERRYAIGDLQAPFERFMEVLSRHSLLDSQGKLAADASLISIGDYFDYGAASERESAAREGLKILEWLAAHEPAQVTIVVGNHDLGRIGELASFSDSEFEHAHELAREAYQDGRIDTAKEAELLRRYPALPTAELAARDFSAFSQAQRELVHRLMSEERFSLAHADHDRLFCHAGITTHYMEFLGLSESASASEIATSLNRAMRSAFEQWESGPFSIPGLHEPGNAASGEGVGMLYHRPANPDEPVNQSYEFGRTMLRRYDARDIPRGLTQIVGHIGDRKCRQLLGADWVCSETTPTGAIRHMRVADSSVVYAAGPPQELDVEDGVEDGVVVFIDGGLGRTPAADYQLYAY